MIEIVFYDHRNDNFTTQNYPLFVIEKFSCGSFADMQKVAQKFIEQHRQDRCVVIKDYPSDFNINLFAVALSVESLRMENFIDCVAIRVDNLTTALEAYTPYISLTFGLKYIHTLQEMDANALFKDLSALGYLGLKITHDYANKSLTLSLNGKNELPVINAVSFSDTLFAASYIKILALMKKDFALDVKLSVFEKGASFNEDAVFSKLTDKFLSLI